MPRRRRPTPSEHAALAASEAAICPPPTHANVPQDVRPIGEVEAALNAGIMAMPGDADRVFEGAREAE